MSKTDSTAENAKKRLWDKELTELENDPMGPLAVELADSISYTSDKFLNGHKMLAILHREFDKRVLTCVYCGHEYPINTPAHGSEVLTEHIKVCDKHPMRALELANQKLRKALVGLVGCDTKAELDIMEGFIRAAAAIPEVDRVKTINAITALSETLQVVKDLPTEARCGD